MAGIGTPGRVLVASSLVACASLAACTFLAGCTSSRPPEEPLAEKGLIVAGVRVPIDAPVVTWKDPGGYDAYKKTCFFSSEALPKKPAKGCNTPERFSSRRLSPEIAALVSTSGWPAAIEKVVDLVVVHYDVAWTSRRCFEVLHDVRGLSCHFLLDVDGTIYQTLDVTERARHAGDANDRSVGIEIAHPGPLELTKGLAGRYERDERGVRFDLGALAAGVRTKGFVVRPARPEPVAGEIHGRRYVQWDFTEEQYRSLSRLLGALSRRLPRIELEAPREKDGRIVATTVASVPPHVGVVGHWHVSREKQDPGPAFDWDRVLAEARRVR